MIIFYNIIPLLLILISYFLGSISASIVISKMVFKKDIRNYGSKNAGAMNTIRTFGLKPGLVVLILDVCKGFLVVFLPDFIEILPQHIEYKIGLSISVIIGHLFPIYYRFKGGKGVATLLGVMLALNWKVSLCSLLVYLLILLITKYGSLSSICGVFSFPLFLLLLYNKPGNFLLIIFGFSMGVLVCLTHYQNIRRLLRGSENKFKF